MRHLLELKKIRKSYNTNTKENIVLNDVSLKIKYNSINTVFGNSGVGKTTLLQIIGLILLVLMISV